MIDLFVAKEKGEEKGKVEEKIEAVEIRPSNNKIHVYLLHSFFENPEGVSFEDQEPDEKILLFVRRHLNTNIHWVFISIILASIPVFLFVFRDNLSSLLLLGLPQRFIVVLTLFYYLVIITYLFVNYITWYFNLFLITNKRIIEVNYADLVYKNVSATKLTLIQDASYKQVGVLRSFFDYGDVLLQTAGSLDNFSFEAVPKPEKVVQIVEKLIGKRD